MERTLKESEALKQCQHTAEELEGYGDVDVNARIAIVWSLIAVHEALHRLIDTLNDLPLESVTKKDTAPLRYWGLWVAPPDGQPGWARNSAGDFLHYPSPVIAEARRVDIGWEHCEVKEFTLAEVLQDAE